MPNWCYNELQVLGNDQELDRLARTVSSVVTDADRKEVAVPLDFERVVPMPKVLHGREARIGDPNHLMKLYSDPGLDEDDWYSWAVRNWGCKWNLDADTDVYRERGQLLYKFETAWSPAVPIARELSRQFPSLRVAIAWNEPGNGSAGGYSFQNGVDTEPNEEEELLIESVEHLYDQSEDEEEGEDAEAL